MKRMSMGQTILRTVLTMILFFILVKAFFSFANQHSQVKSWIQGSVMSLPASMRTPILAMILILVIIALFLLLFLLSGKVISLTLRVAGKDPVRQYRVYNLACREHMGGVDNPLQLEQPVCASDRIRKFFVRTVIILLCLFVFCLVTLLRISRTGQALVGILLGLLAVAGVLIVYFLIWMLAKAVSGRSLRIRRIKK